MNFIFRCGRYVPFYEILFLFLSIAAFSSTANALGGLYYGIERPRHSMTLSYEYENDKRTGTSREADNTTQKFEERLDIMTGGWLVYPRLITFDLNIKPEWQQTRKELDSGEPDKSRSSLLGYSANVTLLPVKPYTFNFTGQRTQSTVSTTFAERSKIETNAYGAGLHLKYNILPTQLNYRHQENKQTGFFDSTNESDKVNLVMNHNQHLGDSTLNAEYQDQTTSILDKTRGSKNLNIAFQNNYIFNKQGRLVSRYSYSETENQTNETRIQRVNESLSWQHTKDLRTGYSFRYNNSIINKSRKESTGIGASLSSQPLKDLSASINTSGSLSRSPGVLEKNYGAGLGLSYNRKIPGGSILLASGHGYRFTSRDVTGDLTEVVDESVTLTSGTDTKLANSHVLIGTIVVTDTTGTVQYEAGNHYDVREVGNAVILSRNAIVSGGIPAIVDGATVLVDYFHQNSDNFDSSIFNQSYTVDIYLWSILKVYYEFENSFQTIHSGSSTEEPEENTVNTVGTEVNWRWSQTFMEYQNRDVSDLPTEILSLRESITLRPYSNIFFNLTGSYSMTKLKNTGEKNRFYNFSSSLQWFPSRNASFAVEGFRRRQSGDHVMTEDTGFSSVFRYIRGIWEAKIKYKFEHSEYLTSGEDLQNNTAMLEFTRNMF